MRSILVGDVRTGRRITQIPVASAAWSMRHRAPGDITVGIPLGASDFAALEREILGGLFPGADVYPSDETYPEVAQALWRPGDGLRPEFLGALDPVRCFLAVVEGDSEILEAGPIWAWDYDAAAQMLQVKASGLGSIFDHRFVMGAIEGTAWAEWEMAVTGWSLATIAKRLIQTAMAHVGGGLPIVLPTDEASDNTRTYNGYDLATVKQRLDELMGVQGGPDIAFQPRFTADRMGVEWVMRTGTVANPLLHQVGDDWVWDTSVPRGGVAGISVQRDATGLAQRAWATGSGMETARLIARADDPTLLDAGFPLVETKIDRPTVEDPGTLQGWADSALSAAARPWMTWSLTVRADMDPALGLYRPGDFARVWVGREHPLLGHLLPAGFHRARILEVSGDLGQDVKVTLSPVMESR